MSLGSGPWKSWNEQNVSPLTVKNTQKELFVITGHNNTFDLTMYENKNEGSFFPPEANLVKLITE